jgi:hypothetical protein
MARHAILIGNRCFPEDEARLRMLRCPENDVNGLSKLLGSTQHGSYAVTPIVDGTHDVARRAIYQCLRKAAAEDLVFIYYSGHGKLDEDGNLYLATKDTTTDALPPTSIPVDDIRKYTRESSAAAVIIVLDCCISGAVGKMFKGEVSEQASQAIRGLEGEGRFFLTASTDTELAEEKEGDEYSLLTKYIIEGIEKGDADGDDDGKISFYELCTFVQKHVAKAGRQRPKWWSLEAGGEVTIAITGKPAADTRRKAVTKKLFEMASQDFLGTEAMEAMLTIVNQPASNSVLSGLTVRVVLDRLYAKRTSSGEFVQEVFKIASELSRSRMALQSQVTVGAISDVAESPLAEGRGSSVLHTTSGPASKLTTSNRISQRSFLRSAIQAIPAVKYALGVAGIVATIAVIRGFTIDPRRAILGTIVMLFLMISLLVFAKWASKPSLGTPFLILTWFSLLLMVVTAILLFTSVFWSQPLQWGGARSVPKETLLLDRIELLEATVPSQSNSWFAYKKDFGDLGLITRDYVRDLREDSHMDRDSQVLRRLQATLKLVRLRNEAGTQWFDRTDWHSRQVPDSLGRILESIKLHKDAGLSPDGEDCFEAAIQEWLSWAGIVSSAYHLSLYCEDYSGLQIGVQ